MQQLFAFLYRYRVFEFYLFLQVISIWLLVSYNNYYNAYFFNSSNQIAGSIQLISDNTSSYIDLKKVNQRLLQENLDLRLELAKKSIEVTKIDSSISTVNIISSKVINNNYRRSENYITINKGGKFGIKPGMGVISDLGAVGIVKSVSKNYATITSILHQNLMVSGQLSKSKTLCTVQWDGIDPLHCELKFVPRHIELNIGDSVVTSGFNSIFPENIALGIVSSVELRKESPFYKASVKLSNDFTSIDYVYVIDNLLKWEKDSLESIND